LEKTVRTDLALEATELWREANGDKPPLPGVEYNEETSGGFRVTTVRVLDERGAAEIGKPVGSYITVELDALIRREENAFADAVRLVSDKLRRLLSAANGDNANTTASVSCLVAGLGNEAITPDAIGPQTLKSVMVTRHLKQQLPDVFSAFREVSAIRAGVLGTTGLESASVVAALAETIKPGAVIAVDALASRRTDRLCRTVQMSDTGITPGSGVGNRRAALNSGTLGVPVIAIGVPTVVDAATLTIELAEKSGVAIPENADFGETGKMIVTPREIDSNVHDISKLVGYAINLALHDGLTIEDVDMFL